MQKAKTYNIADSNIANLGSDLEKKVKLEASQHEEAWKNCGKQPGLQIWRVEQFKIHAVPKETYVLGVTGQFFSGDSYIVLHTYKPKPDSEKLAWDAHFWLGKYTTQDEAGTAAYKTVELDDYLGGAPVQYREVQGSESQRFLGYFPSGLRILEGGIESGFNHVKPTEYRTRLLHLKGKKHVRVTEEPLSHKSLNSGDVFIVDLGVELIQWNGSKAGMMEKTKGAQLCQHVEAERNGKAKGRVIEENDDDEAFWKALGGKGAVGPATDDDEPHIDLGAVDKKLFRLSDATGKMVFSEAGSGKKLAKSLLDSNDVFILDVGTEVIAWVGSKASKDERKYALKYAQEFVANHGKPLTTNVSRIVEGGENPVWNSFFH